MESDLNQIPNARKYPWVCHYLSDTLECREEFLQTLTYTKNAVQETDLQQYASLGI